MKDALIKFYFQESTPTTTNRKSLFLSDDNTAIAPDHQLVTLPTSRPLPFDAISTNSVILAESVDGHVCIREDFQYLHLLSWNPSASQHRILS
ncbi:hypothetical protein Tco_1257402 [Tanacetum coccineum]